MDRRRAILKPFDEAGEASVEEGYVLLDGPDGVAVAMTPDAAARTAESLLAAAAKARTGTSQGAAAQGDHAA